MAAKWWRYNSATHIFEQSLDEGTTWTKPPLNASIITEGVFDPARLGGSLAYTNVTNTFTLRQVITGTGAGTSYAAAPWEIQSATPRVSFHWPGVIASQIGMDSGGIIRTFDNPGTNYAPFNCGTLQTAGYIYPAAVTNLGVIQSAWYLGSHSSYGLYSNTGLYIESNLWCVAVEGRAHIRAASDLYAGGICFVGYGVGFPAAQNALAGANYLDDYEEGTWTPAIPGATLAGYGAYTKVGNKVTVTGLIQMSNKGAGSGQVYITGLPFATANTPVVYSAVAVELSNVSFPTVPAPVGRFSQNASGIWLYYHTATGATPLLYTNLLNNFQMLFGGSYFT